MNKSPENKEFVKSFDREYDTLYVFKNVLEEGHTDEGRFYILCDVDSEGKYRVISSLFTTGASVDDISVCKWARPEHGFSVHDMAQFLHIVDTDL